MQARQAARAAPAHEARTAWKHVTRLRKQEQRAWHHTLVCKASHANWGAKRALDSAHGWVGNITSWTAAPGKRTWRPKPGRTRAPSRSAVLNWFAQLLLLRGRNKPLVVLRRVVRHAKDWRVPTWLGLLEAREVKWGLVGEHPTGKWSAAGLPTQPHPVRKGGRRTLRQLSTVHGHSDMTPGGHSRERSFMYTAESTCKLPWPRMTNRPHRRSNSRRRPAQPKPTTATGCNTPIRNRWTASNSTDGEEPQHKTGLGGFEGRQRSAGHPHPQPRGAPAPVGGSHPDGHV